MKKILPFIILLISCSLNIIAQSANGEKNPAGQWKFEAPYAPEGFTAGTINVGYADGKYSATMAFAASGYSLNGEKVTVRNDSLFFMVWVEGTDVNVALGMSEKNKMTGNAVYFEGSVPLSLTKDEEQK